MAGTTVALSVASIALAGLERLAGREAAAVAAAGVAVAAGVVATAVRAYLLLRLGLADPRALRTCAPAASARAARPNSWPRSSVRRGADARIAVRALGAG